MSQLKSRPPRTIDDYLSLPQDVRAELIEGELYMTPSPRPRHQEITGNISDALRAFVKKHGAGKVFFAPLDVFLPSGSVVQPDLIFIARENFSIIQERIEGVPDLCVEVVSPRGAERDRIVKRRLYAENGVPEYWIVDDESKSVEVLTLDGREYAPFGYFVAPEGVAAEGQEPDEVRSRVLPGFSCSSKGFFRRDV
jgi:Uma2 family endonuclease